MLHLKMGYRLTALLIRPHQDQALSSPLEAVLWIRELLMFQFWNLSLKPIKSLFHQRLTFVLPFTVYFLFFFFFFLNSSVTTSEKLHNSWLLLLSLPRLIWRNVMGLSHHNNKISSRIYYIYILLEYSHLGLHSNCYFTI